MNNGYLFMEIEKYIIHTPLKKLLANSLLIALLSGILNYILDILQY